MVCYVKVGMGRQASWCCPDRHGQVCFGGAGFKVRPGRRDEVGLVKVGQVSRKGMTRLSMAWTVVAGFLGGSARYGGFVMERLVSEERTGAVCYGVAR